MKKIFIVGLFFLLCSVAKAQTTVSVKSDTSHRKPTDSTFTKVEIESEFPGGAKAWNKYLSDNFTYPKAAVRKRIEGTVVVQFIVDRDGKVIDAEVVRSVHPLLDREALRLIQESPKWKPAIQGGRKVKSYKKQPVVFKLV